MDIKDAHSWVDRHADVIAALGKDDKNIQAMTKHGGFIDNDGEGLVLGYSYRLRPKKIDYGDMIVNGFTVKSPINDIREDIPAVYVASPTSEDFYVKHLWLSGASLLFIKQSFFRGLCYERKEDAIARAKAMIGMDPNKCGHHD